MPAEMVLMDMVLVLIGVCGGMLVAAGVYAFITVIGLIPRLMAKTHTTSRAGRYETWIIWGACFGNAVQLHRLPLCFLPEILRWPFLAMMGTACGVFVGCLVMSLAETLDTLPVMSRRIRLKEGLSYIVEALAAGKLLGSLAYFVWEISLP